MTETSRPQNSRPSGWIRIAAALMALGLVCPLVIAAELHPDPSGFGTHRQLGLPPCTFLVLFGRRCPSCGMTTAWAHMVRGQVVEAFRANAGGALLAILALLAVPWLLIAAVGGRWLGMAPNVTVAAWIVGIVFAVTMVDWSIRMLVR